MEEQKIEQKKEETPDFIKQTEALVARQEEANRKHEELLNREAELMAKRMLGGRSELEQKPEKAKMTPKEYRDSIEKGIIPPRQS